MGWFKKLFKPRRDALIIASRTGDITKVQLFFRRGADVNAKVKGWTPLMIAASLNHLEIAKFLLRNDADMNAKDDNGITPIMLAVYAGHAEVVKLLIENGADLNADEALIVAVQKDHVEVARLLIENGANLNEKDKNSTLELAIKNKDVDFVKSLIESGANVNAKNKNGQILLLGSIEKGNNEIAKLLIEKGADLNAKDNKGRTALMFAAFNGHIDIAKLLIESKADVNAKDLKGSTALMFAAENSHTDIAKLLIEKGADEKQEQETVSEIVSPKIEKKRVSYKEKDNIGTRQDTIQKAKAFWEFRTVTQKFAPYALYIFNREEDARDALLELDCIHQAEDTLKLISTETLEFGYYKSRDGKYEAIISGKDLKHELWELARDSFVNHNGTKVNEQEPTKNNEDKMTLSEKGDPDKVIFVREDKQPSTLGRTCFYRIYKAPDAACAKAFLKKNPVTKRLHYLVVETPEGNYGRDIDGIYIE